MTYLENIITVLCGLVGGLDTSVAQENLLGQLMESNDMHSPTPRYHGWDPRQHCPSPMDPMGPFIADSLWVKSHVLRHVITAVNTIMQTSRVYFVDQ